MEEMQVSCRGPNSFVMEDGRLFSSPLTHFRPDPSLISEDCCAVAEETIQEMMNCIHPNLDSEEKRKDVIEYVQRLLRCSLGCEVFPYGSVPLKTYLPDGDIDLTALGSQNIEESLARDVIAVLQEEETNENAEYEVKDTQFIDAEVKLVKCLVQNIVIDISFNQLGGLSTLCFLEQVDRVAGKNHLFKRSIILIKAWCYYESRILGAHHGLISTYALDTLVLYIFHIFPSSLNGPLAVLYRFLDYFSKFDWENYCISLSGPVCKSSLPDLVVEKPENGGADLMLTEEFLRNCMDMFSVPSRGSETNSRAFPQKHINIIDPLKDNNNLGRSVHRGNFYRICSAFKYGARKLGWILSLPKERISDEIKKFFSNTLERHGHKYVIDIRNSALFFEVFNNLSLSSQTESLSDDESQSKSLSSSVDNENLGVKQSTLISRHALDRFSIKLGSSQRGSETCYSTDGTSVSDGCFSGDANDLANSRSLSSRNGNDKSDCSLLSSNCSSSLCGSSMENGKIENRSLGYSNSSNSIDEKLALDSWMEHTINFSTTSNTIQSCISNAEGVSSSGSAISSVDANFPEGLSLDFKESDLTCISGDMDPLNPLSDLSGDYDSHIRSLLYAQGHNVYALGLDVLPKYTPSPSPFKRNKQCDVVTLPLKQNSGSKKSINGVGVTPHALFANSIPSNAGFGLEEQHQAQGTGTYIHNMKSCSCRERPSRGRGNKSKEARGQLQIQSHSNGMTPAVSMRNSIEEYGHESQSAYYRDKAYEKSELSLQSQISSSINTLANGLSGALHKLEFGTLGRLPEVSSLFTSGSSYDKIYIPSLSLEANESKPITSTKGRVTDQLLHIKNEVEFPPLSL